MRFKRILTYVLCFLCIGLYLNTKQETTIPVFLENPMNHYQVQIYRINEHRLIPVAIAMNEEYELELQLKQIIQMMTQDFPILDHEAILPSQSALLEVTIENQVAILNFNSALLNYAPEKELKIIEALVWSMTQFDEIKAIQIKIEGETLNQFPYGTSIPLELNRQFGINNLSFQEKNIHQSVPLNVYIQQEGICFIQTFRVAPKKDLLATLNQLAQLIHEQSSHVELVSIQQAEMKENIFVLDLDSSILKEEKIVFAKPVILLLLSIYETLGYEQFELRVEDEIVSIEGMGQEVILISQLKMNEMLL